MIYIVHFCARFQKFCSGGGSNLYEKAYFAPLICEKNTCFCLFLPPPEYIPPHICSGGAKMLRGPGSDVRDIFLPHSEHSKVFGQPHQN